LEDGASGDASLVSGTMSEMQIARANIASHVSPEATHQFDIALHDAVLNSVRSMDDLHAAVCECAGALRRAEVGPVQLILAMKACAIDSSSRYRPDNDEFPASNVDILIDHIVRWSIEEYYKPVC
jgi:hypothetical protein